ncbi:MAG: hypothetical protein OHK0039_10590 [Bacteroidia bacterium]
MTDYVKSPPADRSRCRFSILLPTWNNLAALQLVVRSIRTHSAFAHQIIVHVNEGRDGTLDWVRSQPDLDYTFSPENIGICLALNLARSLIATDYVVYLNDDMYLCPGWDRVFDAEIRAVGHTCFFFSATMIEPTDTGNPCVVVADYGRDVRSLDEARLLATYADHPKADWQGSTWPPSVVHRDLWDLVGGYSVEFSPGMYSDTDFSRKLWAAGVRLFKGLGAARVYHFGSQSTRRIRHNAGRRTFLRKWGISSGTFNRDYLRRGAPFDGLLAEPVFSPARQALLRLRRGLSGF